MRGCPCPGESGVQSANPPGNSHLAAMPGRLLGVALLLMCLILGGGCASTAPQKGPARPVAAGPVDELQLLSVPVTLNFDQGTGPDGFAVKVFATSQRQPKAFPITTGTLELLMFDGFVSVEEIGSKKPLRTWTYPADQLVRYFFRGSVGVGYEFTPIWGQAIPSSSRITVIARYRPPKGPLVYSAPSSIAVNAR
jgi:hypothetical protein